ncbi:MAG: carboxypeptidase-like regulatory domain-containing protein [Bacteroidia bacterium]|nr:carboxypeptidase-like regulatory domain-containing protein [Bacteroidia bacterium]MBP9689147.1 carboxypeptidase-like regulatory domain-containing protein [Bacteroidia bacterium]
MRKQPFIFFITILLVLPVSLFAQQPKPAAATPALIQLSGLVVSVDSLQGLPLVSIRIKNSNKGTFTDEGGFFSFVVKKTDTILFSFIGYKTVEYIIPQNLKGVKYSIIQPLSEDTVFLNTAVIRSYPTPDEFDYYFVKATIPDAYYEASTRNLRKKTLENIAQSMSMDGSESQRYATQQQAYRYYYNGQLPPNRIFDPLAWGQFFNAWKSGAYKKQP